MASTAAVPFWRSAGMTYITYSNICANLVRNCLKEPYKSESINREKVHFSVSKWVDGKPEKPSLRDNCRNEKFHGCYVNLEACNTMVFRAQSSHNNALNGTILTSESLFGRILLKNEGGRIPFY